jgi:hypothetical protein
MAGFRGDDEALDNEIETLERVARLRLRRHSRDLRDLDRDLRDLKRERVRRRAASELPESVPEASDVTEPAP